MATTAAAKAPVEAPVAAPKKSKLLIIIVIAVVLLGAGGAGAWYFLKHSAADEDEVVEAHAKPSVFLPLDQFTVNLQAEDGQQFLQTALTLKVTEQDVAESIKAQMPEVRSRILLLLSSKKPSQLSSSEGKAKLTEELIQEVEAALPATKSKAKKPKKKAHADEEKPAKKGKAKAKAKTEEADEETEEAPHRVLAVFFTHFIVQ